MQVSPLRYATVEMTNLWSMRSKVSILILRVNREQQDLADAALLPEHMRLCSIFHRQPTPNRQHKLAVAYVIGKLTHLRWIGLRLHTGYLDRGMQSGCIFR